MGKETAERDVRMWPVTAVDRSIVVDDDHTGDDRMVTGGVSVLSGHRVVDEFVESFPLIDIPWQDGTIDPEKGANGVTCEAMADAIIGRLRAYQNSKFKCRENALAITAFEEARNWLTMRREERMKRGVLNTHQV